MSDFIPFKKSKISINLSENMISEVNEYLESCPDWSIYYNEKNETYSDGKLFNDMIVLANSKNSNSKKTTEKIKELENTNESFKNSLQSKENQNNELIEKNSDLQIEVEKLKAKINLLENDITVIDNEKRKIETEKSKLHNLKENQYIININPLLFGIFKRIIEDKRVISYYKNLNKKGKYNDFIDNIENFENEIDKIIILLSNIIVCQELGLVSHYNEISPIYSEKQLLSDYNNYLKFK